MFEEYRSGQENPGGHHSEHARVPPRLLTTNLHLIIPNRLTLCGRRSSDRCCRC